MPHPKPTDLDMTKHSDYFVWKDTSEPKHSEKLFSSLSFLGQSALQWRLLLEDLSKLPDEFLKGTVCPIGTHSLWYFFPLSFLLFLALSFSSSFALRLDFFRSCSHFLSLAVCTLFFLSLSPPIPFTLMHTCTQPFHPLPCLCCNSQQSLCNLFPFTHTHKHLKSGNIQTWVVSWL